MKPLIIVAALFAASAFAAPADDAPLRELVTAYQQAAAQGDGKAIAAITHIPPAILKKKGEAEARAMVEKFLATGLADGGRFDGTFAITAIDYHDNDTRAIIHGTAQTRDGDTVPVRWKAVKDAERGWQFDGMETDK